MSEEKAVTVTQAAPPVNPFQRANVEHVSAGAVAIESERAIAEAQAKMVIAKRFPRDQFAAMQRIIEACSREGLAREAFYSYSRGGSTVSGPSIRMAESLAAAWGNLDYGINELSRRDGESEMQAYCWDLETNTFSQQKFTVAHIRDTKGGGRALTDQRDIYEIGANMGARRLRARILAVIPKDVIDAAIETCKATLAGKGQRGGKTFEARLKDMVIAFNSQGVSVTMIEARLGHKLTEATVDEFADMTGIFNAIRSGDSTVADFFGSTAPKVSAPAGDDAVKPDSKKQASDAAKLPQSNTKGEPEKPRQTKPTKAEIDAAKTKGGTDFKAGAPIEACPEGKTALMDAWREGWTGAKAAATAKPADDDPVPFDNDDGGEDAPALAEPTDDDDEAFGFGA